jgi:hypothetical protein
MKKSKSYLLITVLLGLTALAIYVFFKKKNPSTVDNSSRDFKIKDTAAVTKIFMADKDGNKATIERTKTGWVVNNKFPCRPDAILNLFEVVRNIEVKMPVAKEAKPNVIRLMAAGAIKVEIYEGSDLTKQYYIGHETPESEGSYILLTDVESGKNYDEPFVGFIPGFKGYLAPRFITNENDWRDRVVFNYTPPQLKQIKLIYNETRDSSFSIDVNSTTNFVLKDYKGEVKIFSQTKMKQYLAYFQNISYEGLITNKDKRLEDSLKTVKPFITINIIGKNNQSLNYNFYHKPPLVDPDSELDIDYKYDPDRLFLKFNNDKELALAQYFVFGKFFISTTYFFDNSPVKK